MVGVLVLAKEAHAVHPDYMEQLVLATAAQDYAAARELLLLVVPVTAEIMRVSVVVAVLSVVTVSANPVSLVVIVVQTVTQLVAGGRVQLLVTVLALKLGLIPVLPRIPKPVLVLRVS